MIDRLAADNGFHVNFSLRLIPFFPYDAVSYAAVLTGVRSLAFLSGTLLGALPGTFVYSYLGASLVHGGFGQIAVATALLLAMAAAPWVYRQIHRAFGSQGA